MDYIKKSGQASNTEVYELAIKSGFLPKHINSVIKQLKQENKLMICNQMGLNMDFAGATFIDYKHYKAKDNIAFFKIK